MVNVAIIGPGAFWEMRYGPALREFRNRIRVRAVYDSVMNRADQVAAELNADVMAGMLSLIQRSDIDALLLLDLAWYGHQPLRFACLHRKPAYVAGELGTDAELLHRLYLDASSQGITVMPEFGHRYTPATSRLHELIATQIGRPRRIVVEAAIAARSDDPQDTTMVQSLKSLFDWCRYVTRSAPASLRSERLAADSGHDADGRRITVEFATGRSQQVSQVAEIRIRRTNPAESNGDARRQAFPEALSARCEVFCDDGEAVVESPLNISWTNGTGSHSECLQSDRSAVNVMLDHFCRRVVGGLIPVADIDDVCQSLRLIQSAETSFQTGQPVRFGQ